MDPYRTPSLTHSDASSSSSDPPSLEDRPLPPLPNPKLEHPFRTPPKPSSPLAKSRAWRNMHRNAVLALRQPRLLARILRFTNWDDIYALFATCAGIRHLWASRDIRDVILSHFLPCFRTAVRQRDISALQDIDVTLLDLHLLCLSFLALTCAC